MAIEEPGPGDDTKELLGRIADLKRTLQARDEEIATLRLQLDALSMIDIATGLLSKNGLLDAIEVSLLRLQRQQEPFAVLAFRVPGLTDMLGGDDSTGDVLRHFGSLFTTGLRELDRKARVSMDTFAAAMPIVTTVDMPGVVRRLAEVLTAAPVVMGDHRLEPKPLFAAIMVGRETDKDATAILELALSRLARADRDIAIESL